MADVHNPIVRSYNMSQIKGKDTAPELRVRSWLFSHGYRYRKNDKRLPGKPDIVLPKYKTVIFVHGCFWHRHGCKYTTMPKTRTEFWETKFSRNVERDQEHVRALEAAGWHVIIVWECEINAKLFEITMHRVQNELEKTLVNKGELL